MELLLQFTTLKIHSKDALGDSPLHAAASNFHVACVRLMATHHRTQDASHIHLQAKNKAGKSPLGMLKDCIERLAARQQSGSTVTVSDNDLFGYIYQEAVPHHLQFLAEKA